MTQKPIVAVIQMCSSEQVDKNLSVAGHFIQEAAKRGACLVVLPENFAFMGVQNADRLHCKEPLGNGPIQSALSECAKKNAVWIVAGSIPLASSHPQKVRAACLVYDDKGTMVAHYDKIHLFDASVSEVEIYKESDTVEPGDHIVVVDSPIGRLGLAICFDVRFPALFAQLIARKVEVIALPSAFTVPTGEAHWEILTRSRAIDTFSYLLAAGQGGLHSSGRKTYGHSLIVDPWGQVITHKNDTDPGIIYAEIDINRVYQCREAIPLIPKTV